MRSDSHLILNISKKSSASRNSCYTATKHHSVQLITHRFTTGACATMPIDSKTSGDHHIASFTTRNDARIYLMTEAGKTVSTT